MNMASTQHLTPLRVGGVPEHFNLLWHIGMERGDFRDAGIDLRWRDCPGGTGEMVSLLEGRELDLIVTLTEGSVTAIARAIPMRILQWYVNSPLQWGVHVPQDEPAQRLEDLTRRRVAISREGSGSHLMATVLAEQQGWPLDSLEFVKVGQLDGAIEAFQHNRAELFLWERFTTQPLVDQGLMRRIAVCPTPWPAFVICAHDSVLTAHPDAIRQLQSTINRLSRTLTREPGFADEIARRYRLSASEVRDWLAITQWAQSDAIHSRELEPVIGHLQRLSLLQTPITGSDCLLDSA